MTIPTQGTLFPMGSPDSSRLSWPQGLDYREDFIDVAAETALLTIFAALPFTEARYKQYTARRRTLHFGSGYDFDRNQLTAAPPLPDYLEPLRARVAQWANVSTGSLQQALIAEYRPGTPLGWHRDVPDFELVIGVSLGAAGRLRFRPYPWRPERKADVFSLDVAPRSAYILRGEARWGWQHSVPPVKMLRYSITFRTARQRRASRK